MTKLVVLNNVQHKDLKVVTRYAPEFGDAVNCVLTYPTEYGDVQREYPIAFRKDEAGEYQSIAILGFAKGENLFFDGQAWNASYIPAIVARGPFLIGFQEREINGKPAKEPVMHINLDDPRVSEKEGQALFLRHGGNTPYLERMARMLNIVHDGMIFSKAMFSAFEAYELIEPVNIEIELRRDDQLSLTGLHTINEDKLAQLGGDALEKLNKAGFLQAAFLVVASLNNMKKLIEMKRRRILQQENPKSAAIAE
jgi:hypothetical protein